MAEAHIALGIVDNDHVSTSSNKKELMKPRPSDSTGSPGH